MSALAITVATFAIALLLFALAIGVGKWLAWRGRKRWWLL